MSKKIRVMHIVISLRTGGLERMVIDLTRGLDKSLYDVYVCCLEDKGDLSHELEGSGVQVLELNSSSRSRFSYIRRLASLLKEYRIDIVHTHNPTPHLYGTLAARLSHVPVVIHTKHGRNFISSPFENPKGLLLNNLLSWLTDKIVAVSNNAKEVCLRVEKVPSSKVTVIRNGIDVDRFNIDLDVMAKRREIGVPSNALVVGNVARLAPEKDHFTLFKAFAVVVQNLYNVYLLLVGDGPLEKNLKRLAHELGISHRVKFLGLRQDIPELMRSFDLFVLPSITEGISLTLLEAMASGLPIIATNVGGNPEVVTPGINGLLTPPGDYLKLADHIINMLSDKAKRCCYGYNARRIAKDKFSFDRMLQEYSLLYTTLAYKKRVCPIMGDTPFGVDKERRLRPDVLF